jgi:beta,beta-carotene 9',10'-dioxygenase
MSISDTSVSSRRSVGAMPRARAVAPAEVPRLGEQVPFRWTQRDRTSLPVHVEGALPSWLRGELVRTAPAVFEQGSWQAQHWFDGLCLIYGFSFGDGVHFKQQRLDSVASAQNGEPGATIAMFDTDLRRSWWKRIVQPVPTLTDNTNVNIVPFQGHWLAMTESPKQHVIDADNLRTRGLYDYQDSLPEKLTTTAHPHFDFAEKSLVNIGTTFGAKNELWVVRQRAESRVREVEGKLALKRVPYLHDFGLTERHVVIIDHPLTVNPLKLLWSSHGFIEAFRWAPEQGTRLWKLDRKTGKWTDYLTEPLFCFHTVNTFEEGDDVVLDFVAYEDAGIIARLRADALAGEGLPLLGGRLLRARLSPGKKRAELTQLSSQRLEFPSIAYRSQHGHAYDTVWGAALDERAGVPGGASQSALVRVDLRTDTVRRFAEPEISYGEPVFVPNPGSERADDGVLLAVGAHAHQERSTLLVLDATTMTPLARCHVALSLPLGFHGNFRAG